MKIQSMRNDLVSYQNRLDVIDSKLSVKYDENLNREKANLTVKISNIKKTLREKRYSC